MLVFCAENYIRSQENQQTVKTVKHQELLPP